MRRKISVAEVLGVGVALEPEEAIAVAQLLIRASTVAAPTFSCGSGASDPVAATPADASSRPSGAYGPPTIDNVFLASDGSVSCNACEATPAVSEVGRLLQEMLPAEGIRIPGSLRYTVARALLEVDAPPFDSLSDFSDALERHERGDRVDLVRRLLDRARAARSRRLDDRLPMVDRRRLTSEMFELRRQLRESDERLYDQQRAIDALVAVAGSPPARPARVSAVAVGIAIGLTLAGAGELMRSHSSEAPSIETASIVTPEPAREEAVGTEPAAVQRVIRGIDGDGVDGEDGAVVSKENDVSRLSVRPAERPPAPRIATVRRTTAPAPQRQRRLLDRLHLRWLRGKIVIRVDDL